MSAFEVVKMFLEQILDSDINFKEHFYDQIMDRPISEELVREYLKKTERLLNVESQPARKPGEDKYKIWIKLSSRYSLVLIITISGKDLYILTGWNTDRKWQKSIQK